MPFVNHLYGEDDDPISVSLRRHYRSAERSHVLLSRGEMIGGIKMRPIDADALIEALVMWRDNDPHRKIRTLWERWVRKTGINVLIKVVSVFPTIEAEPVRHGRWVETGKTMFGALNYECSVCRGFMPYYNGYKYCPNCGAKMDGGTDNGR